ncbi:MAG: hypothetical protein C0464_03465 [Cyanobacteria bacterium DS2.008]|nr:hypothetical protein [Cyanobacteria bacterium DS2.008]
MNYMNLTATTINESAVNIDQFKTVLSTAMLNYEVNENGKFYVMEDLDFPVWFSIDTERKLIEFLTYIETDKLACSQLLDMINDLNSQYIIVQFHLVGRRLVGCHWLHFEGGLSQLHFLRSLRLFSSIFCAAATVAIENTEHAIH